MIDWLIDFEYSALVIWITLIIFSLNKQLLFPFTDYDYWDKLWINEDLFSHGSFPNMSDLKTLLP